MRISNIDAPELPDSPKCQDYRRLYAWCDYAAGYRSRDALSSFLAFGVPEVQRIGVDRYGQTLAPVTVNGQDAGDYLVARGLGCPWR